MRLQVRSPLVGLEWCLHPTSFTTAIRSPQYIGSELSASASNKHLSLCGIPPGLRVSSGTLSENAERLFPNRTINILLIYSAEFVYGHQFKDNEPTIVPVGVRTATLVESRTHHLSPISNAALTDIFEKIEILTIHSVIADGPVSAHEGHISVLPLTGVEEQVILNPTILIPVRVLCLSSEQHDKALVTRRADSSPLLPTVYPVKVTTVVGPILNKHP
jgi:hypothetical protein